MPAANQLGTGATVLLVTANIRDGSSVSFIQMNNRIVSVPEPTLIFPPDEIAERMDPPWFASENPDGIDVVGSDVYWSITVRLNADGKAKFYLRDNNGVIEEVTYGHCHHAVFFEDWKAYNEALEKFYQDRDALTMRFSRLVKSTKEKYPIAAEGKKISKEVDEVTTLECYWSNNFRLWVYNYHPEYTRLLWAQDRLEQATKALNDEHKKLFPEDYLSADGVHRNIFGDLVVSS